MTNQTRSFFVVSSLVVAVGLCTGLVAYYNTSLPARRLTIGPPELTYIPANTALVAYADVREVLQSDFRARLSDALPSGDGKHELLTRTGIDLERDVDSVLVGVMDDESAVTLVRGRFDQATLEAKAREHGAVLEEYRGRQLLSAPIPSSEPGTQRGPSAVAFLEPGLVALGSPEAVRLAIDTADGPADIAAREHLMRSISEVETEGNAWVVGEFDVLSAHARGISESLNAGLPPLDRFALSARIDRNVTARLHAAAQDEAAAARLRSSISGLFETGRLLLGQDPQMAAAFNSVRVTGSGTDIEVALTISPEVLNVVRAGRVAPRAPRSR